MNSSFYQAQEIQRPEEVLDLCATVPFLSERRIVVVRNAHKLSQKAKDLFSAYMGRPCSFTTLILTMEGLSEREEKKHVKWLPGGIQTLRFSPLKGRDLTDWIIERARSLGKTLEREAVSLLAEATGGNLWFVASEIEKLALYAGERPAITARDVEYLVMKFHEPPVFAFMDCLFDRKREALVRLHELEHTGINELEVISRIENQIVQHYQVLYTRGGKSPGIHPYVEQKILGRRRLWSAGELVRLLAAVREVEHGIKSGRTLHPYTSIQEAVLGVISPA